MFSHIQRKRFSFYLLLVSTLLCLSCAQRVGDDCVSSNQCALGQFCDLSSTDGYCTMSPCTPTSCPNESVCVTFEDESTYCMALCKTSEDCREGYVCDTKGAVAPFCRVK